MLALVVDNVLVTGHTIYLTARIRSTSPFVVTAQPFPNWPKPLPCQHARVGPCHDGPFQCSQRQTVNHVVDLCPETKLKGGLLCLDERMMMQSLMVGENLFTHAAELKKISSSINNVVVLACS